jgi:adenylate kinase
MAIRIPYETLVFIGKTGCGKGTQAKRLSSKIGYPIFSTGTEVRRIGAQDTVLGRQIQEIQVSGWVPEWLATYLMVKALIVDFAGNGIIFESVARKPEEAKKLHDIHQMLRRSYIVVNFEISDEVVQERMLARQRDEADTTENIEKRLEAYRNETLLSLDFFKSQGKVVTVNADQSEEDVLRDILALLTT